MTLKQIHLQLRSMNYPSNKSLVFSSRNLIQAAIDQTEFTEVHPKLIKCLENLEKMDLDTDISLVIYQVALAESLIENL